MEDYIKPISSDNAVGIDIEYDDDLQKLQLLVQEKSEQQFGEFIAEAEGKNWDEIYHLSSELLLNKSKNLLVMSYFTQSSIVKFGLNGLSDGLKIIYNNLNEYWSDIYPRLEDEDGDYDPDYRVNALSLFSSTDGIVKEIGNAFLIKDSLSRTSYSVKEVEGVITNKSEAVDYPGGLEKLSIDLQIAMEENADEIIAIQNSLEYLKKITNLFEDKINISLKVDNIKQLFTRIIHLISTVSSTENKDIDAKVELNEEAVQEVPIVNKNLNWASYPVSSRKDVNLLLEKIYVYFEKNEPSHPAPLFIRRVQRLMNLNFYQIMQDISPESLDKLETLVGEPLMDNEDNTYTD